MLGPQGELISIASPIRGQGGHREGIAERVPVIFIRPSLLKERYGPGGEESASASSSEKCVRSSGDAERKSIRKGSVLREKMISSRSASNLLGER